MTFLDRIRSAPCCLGNPLFPGPVSPLGEGASRLSLPGGGGGLPRLRSVKFWRVLDSLLKFRDRKSLASDCAEEYEEPFGDVIQPPEVFLRRVHNVTPNS